MVSWNLRAADNCPSYLQESEDGQPVAIPRIESILGRNVRILDASAYVKERAAKSDPSLQVFHLSDIFAEGVPFLGFGMPNVYLGIPKSADVEPEYVKFAAKSLKRGDSVVQDTRNVAQSGILLVFKELPEQAREELFAAAKLHEGTRQWTCVNANCRVMSEAGFTSGGESLEQYYFPVRLLKDLLQHGLEWRGQKIEFDVIRTKPDFLEDVRLKIDNAVWSTLCRHAERACAPRMEKMASQPFLLRIKNGVSNVFGVFYPAQLRFPKESEQLESKVVRLTVEDESKLSRIDLAVSEPSRFGTLLRLLWGPHSLFEAKLPAGIIDKYLPNKLKAFPQEKPDTITKIKKNFLFSKPVVKLIRSQLSASYSRFNSMSEKDLFDMLRTHTDEFPNKYNIVATGDRLILMKIGIQMKQVDWLLSKHVLMSDYSKDVRFAGEILKEADGTLSISNNSGTYQPSFNQLDSFLGLLKELFPNISIGIDLGFEFHKKGSQ